MRPQGDYILKTVADTLGRKYLPGIQTEHDRSDFVLSIMMIALVAEEFEHAAQRCIDENSVLRKIFQKALPIVKGDNLARRLTEAIKKTEADFHVSALNALNYELQEVLIDLHAHVETTNGTDARTIEEAIWNELADWTKRREFAIWQVVDAMMDGDDQLRIKSNDTV